MRDYLDRLVAEIARDPGPGMTPGAVDLLEEITSGMASADAPRTHMPAPSRELRPRWPARDRPARDWPARGAALLARSAARYRGIVRRIRPAVWPAPPRRWRAAALFTCALTAAALAASWLLPARLGMGPRPASAALDIEMEHGFYVITVRDLFADPRDYQAELRAHGLSITLYVVPAAPSMVGTVAAFDRRDSGLTLSQIAREKDRVSVIQREGACSVRPSLAPKCEIGLRVPASFTRRAEVTLGRPARPGERYLDMASLDNPGEPLQCVEFVNKTVDHVRAMLRERGVAVDEFDTRAEFPLTSVPGSWYVYEGLHQASNLALLEAGPAPLRSPPPMPEGCGKAS